MDAFSSKPGRRMIQVQERGFDKSNDVIAVPSVNEFQHISTINDVMTPRKENDITSYDVNSFHRAICPVLIVAQSFAIMPVEGVTSANASGLRFRWLNFRVLFTIFTLICVLLMATFNFIHLVQEDSPITYKKTMIVVFFSIAVTNLILYLNLATKWPSLMLKIHHFELSMKLNYGYPKNFSRKLRIISALILASSAFEHILANMKAVRRSIECAGGSIDWINIYFINNYPNVIEIVGYSPAVSVLIQLTGLSATFSWNYMDLFVIMFSMMLTSRMQQMNMRFDDVRHKITPASFWRQMVQDYSSWASIVKLVDDHINQIVAVSFFNNLYFICLQLFNSIKHKRDARDDIYFYVSFGHLLLRSTAMCLFAARIHEESRHPKSVLFSVPSTSYTIEVQRLIVQVTTDHIALTGLNFFSITKTMLLTIAGTIATYEIVLLQLNTLDSDEETLSTNKTYRINPFCPNKVFVHNI